MRGRDKCRRWAMRNIRTISTGWAELEVGSMFGAYLHNGTIVAATNRWSAHATAKRLEQIPRRSRTGYDIDRDDRDGPVELAPHNSPFQDSFTVPRHRGTELSAQTCGTPK